MNAQTANDIVESTVARINDESSQKDWIYYFDENILSYEDIDINKLSFGKIEKASILDIFYIGNGVFEIEVHFRNNQSVNMSAILKDKTEYTKFKTEILPSNLKTNE